MAEEEEKHEHGARQTSEHHHEGLGKGEHHKTPEDKKQKHLLYWGLGIGGAGLLLTLLLLSKQNGSVQGTPVTINGSTPFYPNPTDTSFGTNDYWPQLPSGTPSTPKPPPKTKKQKDHDKVHHPSPANPPSPARPPSPSHPSSAEIAAEKGGKSGKTSTARTSPVHKTAPQHNMTVKAVK